MFVDNSLSFNTNWQSTQTVTTTADSTTVVDITGAGVGNAPTMIGGNSGVIGADIGIGDGEAYPYVWITVVVAGGNNSNTLTVSLKNAPANTNNTEGTYTTCYTSGAILDSALAIGTVLYFPIPPRAPGAALPRFYKLTYTASATLTPLQVAAGIVLNPPSLGTTNQYPNNFLAI